MSKSHKPLPNYISLILAKLLFGKYSLWLRISNTFLSIKAAVKLVEPNNIERTAGKSKRVIDNRKIK